jgi:hypothetical protein
MKAFPNWNGGGSHPVFRVSANERTYRQNESEAAIEQRVNSYTLRNFCLRFQNYSLMVTVFTSV